MDARSLDKLDRGPLTDEDIAMGMHLSFKNARELHEDALLLYQNGRFGRTLSLLVLALEELGRIPALLNAVLIKNHDQKMWSRFWKGLCDHSLKQGVWTTYGRNLADNGHPHARYFTSPLSEAEARLLDKFKQCGFYATCFDGNFLSPNMFAGFDKQKIENLFELVKNRIDGFNELHSRSVDSYRLVSQARESIAAWSEERLRQEIEAVFAEWTNRIIH